MYYLFFCKDLENEDNHKIILTGGNANFFKNMFENVFIIDDLFTSRGLHYLINEFDKWDFQKMN